MTTSETYDVAVLGCGLMGSAFARRFTAAGLRVTAWNRTPARAEALAAHGITPAASVGQAVAKAGLVVVCMADVKAAREALAPVTDLTGTAIVNVSDGTHAEAAELERELGGRGASLLDGATFCYPEQIGDPGAMLAFSGAAQVWQDHGPTLVVLGGRTRYLSTDLRAAKALYFASGGFFVTALSGFVEAAACLLRGGSSEAEIDEITQYVLDLLRHATPVVAAAMGSDHHETDQATIHVFAEGARKGLGEMEAAGVDATVMRAVAHKLDAAERAGLGHLGYSAQSLL